MNSERPGGFAIESTADRENFYILLAAELDSEEQALEFYRRNQDYVENPELTVYGNSDAAEESAAESDSWGVFRTGEWAVDVENLLEDIPREDEEREFYQDIANHVAASTMEAVALAEERHEAPKNRGFYRELVEEVQEEKPGMIRRVADLQEDSRGYMEMAKDEGYRGAAKKHVARSAIDKVESKAESKLESAGAIKYLDKVEGVRDRIDRVRWKLERIKRRERM